MRKKITISDVAKAAGVSTTTVSRVMSGTGRISQLTRERVFAIIEKLDYQPSAIAKGLIEAKTYNIGLMLSPYPEDYNIYENNFFQLFLQGVVMSLKEYQYDVIISHGEEKNARTLEKFVKRQKIEGIIIMNPLLENPHILKLMQMNFPFICIGETNIKNTTYVDININNIFSELVDRLSTESKNKIAFLATDENLYGNQVKSKALKTSFKNNDLEFIKDNIYIGNDFFERQVFLQSFIFDNDGNKSIITADYNSLLYVINYAKENNITIPKDLQIVTFNDNQLLSLFSPSITAIETPATEMGEEAGENLMRLVLGEKNVKSKFILDGQITYRESTL